jgi:ribosome-associated protein
MAVHVRHVALLLLSVFVTPSQLLLASFRWDRSALRPHRYHQRIAAAPLAVSHSNSKRSRREALLRDLESPLDPRYPEGEAIDDPAAPLALAACKAADDRKALQISAMRVSHLTSATSFFVSMSGRSKAQINAIVKNVEDELDEQFGRRANRQGKAISGWICLDYDAVVVNVFSEAQREFYGIEKYWAAGQALDLSGVLSPSGPETAAQKEDEKEEDVDDWELDDWSLDDDDDDDDDDDEDWTLGTEAVSSSAAADAVPFDFSADADMAPAGGGFGDGAVAEFVPEDDDDEYDDLTEDELRALEEELDAEIVAAEAALASGQDVEDDEMDGEALLATGSLEFDGGADGGDDLFGEFGGLELSAEEEEVEAAVLSPEEEEAAEQEALARAGGGANAEDDEEGGADWALGDDRLRAIVESAERKAMGDAKASGDGAGGWREMMAEDGWSEEALEAELAKEALVTEDDDDEQA